MEYQMDMMYEKALQLSNWGRTDDAVKAAEQFLAYYPDSYEGYYLLSEIYFNANEFEKAIEFVKKALSFDPLNHKGLTHLAILYYFLEMFDEYEQTTEFIVSEYPDIPGVHTFYASYLADFKQDYEKARFYIEKAVEIEPDDPYTLMTYSNILALLFEDPRSKEYSNRALAQYTEDDVVLATAASSAYNRGDYSKALLLNKTAIKLEPNDEGLLSNLMLYTMCDLWFMRFPLKIRRFHEKLRLKRPILFWPLLVVATFILKLLIFPYLAIVYGTPHILHGLAVRLAMKKMPEQMRTNVGGSLPIGYLIFCAVVICIIIIFRWLNQS
ncbi:tetratricopeptide repeat protein [Bacillus sp. WMMC1349]|uniref:tetratricopeptide repeat protein n=1 Tax=Bacillus sp. WMMC1349 TaxID=2736254 RepID=UPI001552A756|nr:tetratricopeptide repeat protein [Bacillus sp. WMMC1349]NPC94397.1 tetratricopeptide repeat protein [Bacillus sp. WMMC1349]